MPNATLRLNSGRQYPLVAIQEFDYTHVADNVVQVQLAKLPVGAVVTGGELIVDTAWNTGTSASLSIGDTASGTRYGATLDLKTTGRKALTPTGYVSDGAEVMATPVLSGTAATAGKARLILQYVISGRAHEAQTN